ncbi:MAG: hypothetical protein ACOY4R_13775 [Pseudomonadota bacterium]
MHASRIAAVVVGGIIVASAPAAMAQSMAYAVPAPRSEVLVFLEKGNQVPDSAVGTLSMAVVAAQAGRQVEIIGRAEQAAAVKRELIREGAPASRIAISSGRPEPLPQLADNITDPADRRVELKF